MNSSTLHILGASGGFGKGRRTTSFLWNDDILIDAGTGVGDLTLEQMIQIDYLFLTHAHLDHVTSLPFLLDAVGAKRHKPLEVFALPQTIAALQSHLFNDTIWPDFTKIPSRENPFLKFTPIELGQTHTFGNRSVTSIPALHTQPALGYCLSSASGKKLVFTGDSVCGPDFWKSINEIKELKHLIIETSFTNEDEGLADTSKHLTPTGLIKELKNLNLLGVKIHITHLKPGFESKTFEQIVQLNQAKIDPYQITVLKNRIMF